MTANADGTTVSETTAMTVVEELSALNRQMLQMAEDGLWDALGPVLSRRNELLMALPVHERAAQFNAAVEVNETLQNRALCEQRLLATSLTKLRRGRSAASAYRLSADLPR